MYLNIILLFLILVVVTLYILFSLVSLFDSVRLSIPFIKTRSRIVPIILNALKIDKGSVIYDLGSGSGSILIGLIKDTEGVRGVGYETGILPYFISRCYTRKLPIEIRFKNLLEADLSEATHIYCYLSNSFMEKLEAKVKNECNPGTTIISCDFPFPNITAYKTIDVSVPKDTLGKIIYIYKI